MNNYPLSIQTRINNLRERTDNNFTEKELESKANTFKLQEKIEGIIDDTQFDVNSGKTVKPVKPTIT